MRKTNVLRTPFTVITNGTEQSIEIVGSSIWDLQVEFVKQDRQLSLDENGDMFEPEYKLVLEAKKSDSIVLDSSYAAKQFNKDIQEITILFEFLEKNKQNLFEELGFYGVLL